ncbi:MAG: aminotransferase class III-fold pyridoxal phosphate-dependent enzyme [Ignavibacteriaceae bacterium]
MQNKLDGNDFPTIINSDKLYQKALELIPATTQTLAKGPQQNVKGVAPKYLQKGKGSHVWDVDGNEYIDYNMGIGPLSLGYAYPKVDDAIKNQLKDGITFSLMHPLEIEVAELINEVVPNAESIRYSKTGADATSAAIRVARAYTGREKILCCGYHGWHDWYISVTDKNSGIPESTKDLTFTVNYNDIDSVKDSIDSDIAAIILMH